MHCACSARRGHIHKWYLRVPRREEWINANQYLGLWKGPSQGLLNYFETQLRMLRMT